MEWQPIDTAPKDGRDILVAWSSKIDGKWFVETAVYFNGKFSCQDDMLVDATHWQPLPPPPK